MILITNDDGYCSLNLHYLYNVAKNIDKDVKMVVSMKNQSGVGNMSSSFGKIFSQEIEDGYIIDGTPVDCIRFGLSKYNPTLILTGINEGYNIGKNCLYCSGTFMSAREGAVNGIKSLAISIAKEDDVSVLPIENIIKESLEYDFELANLNIKNHILDKTKVCENDYKTVIKNDVLCFQKLENFEEGTDAKSIHELGHSSLSIIKRG